MVIDSVQGIVTIGTVILYILHRSRARTCPQLVDPATLINIKLCPTRLVPAKARTHTSKMTLLPWWKNLLATPCLPGNRNVPTPIALLAGPH